jgi:hypothetical protein
MNNINIYFIAFSKFQAKKTDSKTIGGLAMRKARISNYYNKRSQKGNKKNYRAYTLRMQARNILSNR